MTDKLFIQHGVMTDISNCRDLIGPIPDTIEDIIKLVHNIYLHPHVAHLYNVEVTPEGWLEPHVRDVASKFEKISLKGYTPLTSKRTPSERYIGICRDFSVTTVAFLRELGIPSRARCGFATYLTEGKHEDHWVAEYYNQEEERWIKVDAQLDPTQRKIFKVKNPLDISDDEFISAPRAWQLCRQGKTDINSFGILDWWGYEYLCCNLILDANALLKIPMQPWDIWPGYKSLRNKHFNKLVKANLDDLAEHILLVDQDYPSFVDFMNSSDNYKVPKDLRKVEIATK